MGTGMPRPFAAGGPSADDDGPLIAESGRGSREAFTALVRRHQGAVRRYLASYVDERSVADDLAQEVFVSALRSLETYQASGGFRAWLIGIARHRALEHLRREGRRATRERDEMAATLLRKRLELVESDGERLVDRIREMSALDGCLERLPPRSAAIVADHYFRGRRLVDLARDTGRTEEAVRTELLRIRRALRKCVEGRLAAGGEG
jgi:RNA polymerase sigma-70 factor (ECF subfamily)